MKPSETSCKKLCKLYPCNRTECDRRKAIVYDTPTKCHIELLSKKRCDELDRNMKMREYRALGEIIFNGRNFKRKKV